MDKSKILKNYVPSIYKDVTEMDALLEAEQPILNTCMDGAKDAFLATFIPTATLDNGGIENYEKLLGVIPQADETEEFRRNRIFERWNWKPPYTLKYLRNVLNRLIGPGRIIADETEISGDYAYEMWVDYNNYALYIEMSTGDQRNMKEVVFFVESVKPCNITITRNAVDLHKIKITEEVVKQQPRWFYYLGRWNLSMRNEQGQLLPFGYDLNVFDWHYVLGSWKLNAKDSLGNVYKFNDFKKGDIVKMASTPSLTDKYLHAVAESSLDFIAKVIINKDFPDEFEVPDLTTKISQGNLALISYTVSAEQTREIKTIDIYDENDLLMSHSNVHIPIDINVLLKHNFQFKEGLE